MRRVLEEATQYSHANDDARHTALEEIADGLLARRGIRVVACPQRHRNGDCAPGKREDLG